MVKSAGSKNECARLHATRKRRPRSLGPLGRSSLLHVFTSNLALNGRFCVNSELKIKKEILASSAAGLKPIRKHPALKLNINGKVHASLRISLS
jgi:hypothetical protein